MSLVDDFGDAYSKYVSSPGKQFSLGWIVTSLYFTLPVLIGIILITYAFSTILFNDSYLSGSKSKKFLVFVGWIGWVMIFVGFVLTIRNFNLVVKRINSNIRVNREDSLFQDDTAVTSFISQVNRGANSITTRDALENPASFVANKSASISRAPKVTRESLLRNEPTPLNKNELQQAAANAALVAQAASLGKAPGQLGFGPGQAQQAAVEQKVDALVQNAQNTNQQLQSTSQQLQSTNQSLARVESVVKALVDKVTSPPRGPDAPARTPAVPGATLRALSEETGIPLGGALVGGLVGSYKY
jgi:hypothetical protein